MQYQNHNTRRRIPVGPEKRTHQSCECHIMITQRQQTDLEFPIQNSLFGLTTTRISKNQSHCFQQN